LAVEERNDPWNAIGIRMLHQLLDEPLKISAANTSQILVPFSNSSRRRKTLTYTTISLEFWLSTEFKKLLPLIVEAIE
jgi:hypothetical protein